jgi:hypothetical protein
MKSRIRLLNLMVSSTLILLAVGAVLVVLGIFNTALKWDIFGPKLEAVLYGVFGSCMALAAFGVAMTGIVALQESVKDFKRFVQSRTQEEPVPDAPRRAYAARMALVIVVMGCLVGLCALANHAVLSSRCVTFKRLTREQLINFEKRIVGQLETLPAPPQNNVPRDLYDVIRTIDHLDFVSRTTLYVADPAEPGAMWGFTAWRDFYTNSDGFARFYIAKDFEKAMRRALDGDASTLDRINGKREFTWYKVLASADGKAKGIVRVDGDSRQSFRDYRLGE